MGPRPGPCQTGRCFHRLAAGLPAGRPGRAHDPNRPAEPVADGRTHTNVAASGEEGHVRTRHRSDLRPMCAGTDAPNLDAMTARTRAHSHQAECSDWTRSEPSRERSFVEHEHTFQSSVGRPGARHSRRLAHARGVAAALLVAVCMFVVFSASSGAAAGNPNSPMSRAWSNETGIQHQHFRTAPLRVLPGQNAEQWVTATGTRSRTLLVGSWHGEKGSYTSIQAAVDAAKSGDWILVGPGDYHESPGSRDGVRITTPNIHLRGLTRSGVIV